MAAKRRYKRKGRKISFPYLIVAVVIALALLIAERLWNQDASKEAPDDAESLVVHYIDVGQGDATLIEAPSGEKMLIDAGPGASEDALITYLDGIGIETIDYFILTHPDEDHIGGADLVFFEYTVNRVMLPDCQKDTQAYENLESAITAEGCERIEPMSGNEFVFCEGGDVTVLAPIEEKYSDVNDYSIVLRLDYYETSFLFVGDAQKESEYDMIETWTDGTLDCDVLKVGHHGSSTSSTAAFLNSVTPKLAVISCGEDNKYGHPHAEVLDRFSKDGVTVYRTDMKGTVLIESDGRNVSVFEKTS